jgi:adenylate kinase family enzyme
MTVAEDAIKNEYLGKIIDGLFKVSAAPERKTYVSKLEPFPLKVILLGKPFSGKHTVAQTLVEHCGVKMVTVEDIFQAAIQAAEKKETMPDEKGKPVPTTRAQLGAKAQEALLQGKPVDETVTVSLVADAIRTMNVSIANDAQSKGWVLIDFPKTKVQAQALEKELSGYEDPKPAKLGNLKRGKESAGKDRNRSLIASAGAAQEQAAQPESIIDAIFVLDVENNNAIHRSAGRRLDPITGKVYHLEFNPPPADVPVRPQRSFIF